LQPGVDGPPDLLHREVLQGIVVDHLGVEFLPDASTEQVAQLHQVKMAMHATPTTNLVMIQSQFLLGLTKTILDRPTPKSDPQQPPQGYAAFARHTVRHEVFDFAGHDAAGHDQALSPARQAVAALTPEHGPFHFPDFGAARRVFDAVTLPTLLLEPRRITQQVSHLPRRLARGQTRILFLAAPTRRRPATPQHVWFFQPAAKVPRYLRHENLAALFEAIQEGRIVCIKFVERPGLHTQPVAQGAINQVQGDLRLGAEHHVVGHVVFFRRAGSLAHASGR
jgi:hypothetical protein